MPDITIVPMAESHLNAICAIEEACFTIPWSRSAFERELRVNDCAFYFTALADDTPIGYAGLWHVVNEGHITNVAVSPDYRRQGVGRLLVSRLVELAVEKEMIGLTLEVRAGNEAAQTLYRNHGFRMEGFRKNYYADTKEDAVVMWKHLSNMENMEINVYDA